jgi:thiopurine S-methyltransferase
MEAKFWIQRWEENNIGFHKSEANPHLVKFLSQLGLAPNSRVFLPLCGKTLDISWLLAQGHRVVGAELSEIAITQLFEHLRVKPLITARGKLTHYSAERIDIFVGDIFDLTKSELGDVAAIYDRAALVALPEPMRHRYTNHLRQITGNAPQLLLAYEYDQALIAGPPFSVSDAEIEQHYRKSYSLTCLASMVVEGGMKGFPAKESVWLLR